MTTTRPCPAALLLTCFLAAGLSGRSAAQQPTPIPATASSTVSLSDTARVRKWQEDVHWITTKVRELHPRPFTHCPAASFDSASLAITSRIATTDDARLATECMRMVAMLRDGHTALIGTVPSLGFMSVLPVVLRPFHDGLYVVSADSAYASAVGAKVAKVGDVTTDEALARVASATNADNRYTELDRAPALLMMPRLLWALGVSRDPESVTLELERAGGKRETVKIAAGSAPDGFPMAFLATEPAYPSSWTSARRVDGAKLPRCDQRPGDAWWFEFLPESKIVYLRIRQVQPVSNGVAYTEFWRQLFFAVDSLKPQALVIDLRHDHGGNNTVLDPLIRGLIERPWLDREGGVFALIDRGTFSAAMNAAVFLDDQTRARFVGEPTGGRVNHYGDALSVPTPNYGMLFNVSTIPWLSRFPQDGRPYVAPAIATPWTFATWRDGKDLAMDAAIDAARNGTLATRVLEASRRGGAKAGKEAWDAWNREHPNPWEVDRMAQIVTLFGDLGDAREWRDARVLAEAATVIDPAAAVPWRLLGEAELHVGNRSAAVTALKKAVEINPRSPMARLLLTRLGEKVP